jgi:hypothetical protein
MNCCFECCVTSQDSPISSLKSAEFKRKDRWGTVKTCSSYGLSIGGIALYCTVSVHLLFKVRTIPIHLGSLFMPCIAFECFIWEHT